MILIGFALEEAEEILAAEHEQLGRLSGRGVGGALLSVEHGDLSEQVARAHEIEGEPAAVRRAGLDADLAAPDSEQGVAGIALLEQHLAR